MSPKFVGAKVGGVEIFFLRVKDHAVDASVRLVRVVLDVLFESLCGVVCGKDGTVTGVVVEWVAVDTVRRLVGSEEEDGTGICCRKRGIG